MEKINFFGLNKERNRLVEEERFRQLYNAVNTAEPTNVRKVKNKCYNKYCNQEGTEELIDSDGDVHVRYCKEHGEQFKL